MQQQTLLTIVEHSVLWLYYFCSLNDTGHYMYHPLHYSDALHFILTVYLWFSCDSHNKQWLFPWTVLTGYLGNGDVSCSCVHKIWISIHYISLYSPCHDSGGYHQPLTICDLVQVWVSLCEICGGRSPTRASFFFSASVFPIRYHSANPPSLHSS